MGESHTADRPHLGIGPVLQAGRHPTGPVAGRRWPATDEWSSDRVVDPGDSHDKGEPSLCVGEAA